MRAMSKAKVRPPVRVRYDPPTLEEAVFAAQGLTDDTEHQTEIAAELMGVSLDEAREMVAKAAAKAATAKRQGPSEVAFTTNRSGAQRAVVVERKPSVTVERKSAGGNFKIERSGGVTVERKPFRGLTGGTPRTLIRLGGR
jgi:ribosomal protein L12E/L44/L45/RPP1/RPP2